MITSYEDMPVGVYEKIMAALADEGSSDNDKTLALLAALTGKSIDTLLDEPLEDFRKENDAASFVLVYPVPHKVRDTYTLRGQEYRATLLERKMTAGQYIDFNELAKDEGAGERWSALLSVILVPVGHTYGNGYDIVEVQDAIREELCILDAIALRAFFLTSSAASAADTLPYLEKMMKKMGAKKLTRREIAKIVRQQTQDLRLAGAGFPALMRWLKLPDAVGMLQPQCPQ